MSKESEAETDPIVIRSQNTFRRLPFRLWHYDQHCELLPLPAGAQHYPRSRHSFAKCDAASGKISLHPPLRGKPVVMKVSERSSSSALAPRPPGSSWETASA
jgi:hypothetical protein